MVHGSNMYVLNTTTNAAAAAAAAAVATLQYFELSLSFSFLS